MAAAWRAGPIPARRASEGRSVRSFRPGRILARCAMPDRRSRVGRIGGGRIGRAGGRTLAGASGWYEAGGRTLVRASRWHGACAIRSLCARAIRSRAGLRQNGRLPRFLRYSRLSGSPRKRSGSRRFEHMVDIAIDVDDDACFGKPRIDRTIRPAPMGAGRRSASGPGQAGARLDGRPGPEPQIAPARTGAGPAGRRPGRAGEPARSEPVRLAGGGPADPALSPEPRLHPPTQRRWP